MPFSHVVRTPEWRAEAEAWTSGRLADLHLTRTGPIDQPRVLPWSTQLVVPTDRGAVWFKANCVAQSFEPTLQTLLARLAPDEVEAPLAIDGERGWMLTRDRGATLPEQRAPTLRDWERVLAAAATLQRLVADHASDVLAAGVPNCAPDTVPARLERMLGVLGDLPDGHPAHLSDDAACRLRAAGASVSAAARTLSDSPFPVTLQHGDLHPGNVFAVEGGLRIFDFGDAQWAHPLESLCVPWGATRGDPSIPWAALVAAYHEAWRDLLTLDDTTELLAAAVVTQPVNRSLTWWECLAEASDDELRDWGDRPRHHLTNVLVPWP